MTRVPPQKAWQGASLWDGVRGVILDLDGTLYDQRLLRRKIALALLRHYLSRPWRAQEISILFHFRRLREGLSEEGGGDVSARQFAAAASRCQCSEEAVRQVTEAWLHRRPLRLLPCCRYPFADTLLSWLAKRQIMVAVLSDYPTQGKLEALGLGHLPSWCATDPEIDRLKPDPAGLLHICARWGLAPGECMVIGDRDDRDGEAARRAGMRSVVVPRGLTFRTIGEFEKYAGAALLERVP